MPGTTHIKEEARRIVEELPEDATWGDLARLVVASDLIPPKTAFLECGDKF